MSMNFQKWLWKSTQLVPSHLMCRMLLDRARGCQDSLLKFSSKGLDLGLELEVIDKE